MVGVIVGHGMQPPASRWLFGDWSTESWREVHPDRHEELSSVPHLYPGFWGFFLERNPIRPLGTDPKEREENRKTN